MATASSSSVGLQLTGSGGGGSGGGGMEELLPLVLQLTNPEQVRFFVMKKGEGSLFSRDIYLLSFFVATFTHIFTLSLTIILERSCLVGIE